VGHARPARHLDQALGAQHIDFLSLGARRAGQVHHALRAGHGLRHTGPGKEVAGDRARTHDLASGVGHDPDLVTGCGQAGNQARAKQTGAPGDENLHTKA